MKDIHEKCGTLVSNKKTKLFLTCVKCEILHVICEINKDYFCLCGDQLIEIDPVYKTVIVKDLEFDEIM